LHRFARSSRTTAWQGAVTRPLPWRSIQREAPAPMCSRPEPAQPRFTSADCNFSSGAKSVKSAHSRFGGASSRCWFPSVAQPSAFATICAKAYRSQTQLIRAAEFQTETPPDYASDMTLQVPHESLTAAMSLTWEPMHRDCACEFKLLFGPGAGWGHGARMTIAWRAPGH
jgi:hypothetical protein